MGELLLFAWGGLLLVFDALVGRIAGRLRTRNASVMPVLPSPRPYHLRSKTFDQEAVQY
jgi:hypothetical protein